MKTWFFVILLMGMIAGGVGYYYNTSQARLQAYADVTATLQANNQRLLETNQQNLDTITELNRSFEQITENYNRIQSEFQVIRMQNNELRERLGRHELGALAASRPSLVERTINNASANALRCFELLSGAPMNEREINATTDRQFNSECPWIRSNAIR
jgi:regulator of replication initiation timing